MQNGRSGRGGLVVAAGAALAGLAAGLAASAGRKAALNAAEVAFSGDWFDALKAEHLEIVEAFDLLEQAQPEEPRKRRRLAHRLKALLDKHAFQEESVVYPALRLSGGAFEAADGLVDDHAEMKSLLYLLERTEPPAPEWSEIVSGLRLAVEAHIRREEDDVFPVLQATLGAKETAALTVQMLKAGSKFA